MGFLWLVVGVVIGLLVAWFFLRARYQNQLTAHEAEWSGRLSKANAALEQERAKRDDGQLVQEIDARNRRIAELEASLAEAQTKSTRVVAAVPTVETPGSQASGVPLTEDDLTRIKGIGPVLKEKLHRLGIKSFQQIAEFTDDDIKRVNDVLDFPGRIEREKWVEQARDFLQH